MKLLKLNLFAFGEGAGAAAGGNGAAGSSGSNAAPAQPQSGSAPDAQAQASAQMGGQTPPQSGAQEPPAKPSFDELIKGEYKQDYESRMQAALDRRFKSYNAELAELQPIMALLKSRYGVEDGRGAAAAVRQALENDNAYWQTAADAAGMTPEQYRRLEMAEAQSRQFKALLAQQQTEARRLEALRILNAQAEQVKAQYPDFDINAELRDNPKFGDLIRNQVDMLTAYQVCHQKDFLAAAQQQAEAKAQNRVRANQSRPAENGTGGAQAVKEIGNDPSKWTKAQLRDVQKRVARGERIVL